MEEILRPLRRVLSRTTSRVINVRGGLVQALDFRHDLLNRRAFQPAVTVARVVAGAGPIETEEAGETVQP